VNNLPSVIAWQCVSGIPTCDYHDHLFASSTALHIYSVSQTVAPPPKQKKTFCNNFTQVKCISLKFRQFVATLYPHNRPTYIVTNFGRFILIFNKMALIFLGLIIIFAVSSFEFQQISMPCLQR